MGANAEFIGNGIGKSIAKWIGDRFAFSPWSPADIPALRQRFLDALRTYSASPLDSRPILTPEEPGTLAVPRAGRCFLFDGSNDYATGTVTGMSATSCSVMAWIKFPASGQGIAVNVGNTATGYGIGMGNTDASSAGVNLIVLYGNVRWINCGAIAAGWHHIALVVDADGDPNVYVDGELFYQDELDAPITPAETLFLGAANSSTLFFSGSIRDVRLYSEAKLAGEVLAISDQELTLGAVDNTSIVAGYWCEEESGTTAIDWSGNGFDLTMSNITQLTFHATDSSVTYSAANSLGHTLTGAVIIPRDESDTTKDASGGTLEYAGPLKLPATTEVPCVTGDGSATYCTTAGNVGITTGHVTITAWYKCTNAGTNSAIAGIGDRGITGALNIVCLSSVWYVEINTVAYITGPANDTNWHHHAVTYDGTKVSYYYDGSLYDEMTVSLSVDNTAFYLLCRGNATGSLFGDGSVSDARLFASSKSSAEILAIKNGTTDETGLFGQWPIQDGPGDDNTNRTIRDVSGNDNHLSVVSGTVSAQWANTCPVVKDHCIEHGGRLTTQNLLTYSEQFYNAAWSKPTVDVTADSTVAPDGTSTADTLVCNSTGSYKYIRQAPSLTQGTTYTFSVYLKYLNAQYIWLLGETSSDAFGWFDVQNGVVGTANSGVTCEIESAANGFYKCSITFTKTSSSSGEQIGLGFASSDSDANGVQFQSVYAWGAQLNVGSTAAAYQPTTDVAVPANVFVPALLDGSECADGQPLTLEAGTCQNPGTRLVPNLWGAPALTRIGYTSATKLAVGDDVQSISPADTKFCATDGTRFFASDVPLVGINLTNAQDYIA